MLFRKKKTDPIVGTPDVASVRWGNLDVPAEHATHHFLAVGTTGSGKTTILRLLMQSALPTIGTGRDGRALIYDAKQDVLPLLHSIAPKADIVTTDPFDSRGAAWDLQRDVREPRVAVEIAFTLIPREHESQPFFSDAARHLLYGVMVSFMRSGVEWTFADLLRAVRSTPVLKFVLRKHPETRDLIGQYFFDRRLASNIMSTIATKMLPFEPIAGCWDVAERRVALSDWIDQEMILVFGNSEISRTAVDAMNRCLFKRASDITLHQSESRTRRNWIIVDELADAGKLSGFGVMEQRRGHGRRPSQMRTSQERDDLDDLFT